MKLPDEIKAIRTPGLFSVDEVEAIVRHCANIAKAIDSGRGNEAEIARSILRDFGLDP